MKTTKEVPTKRDRYYWARMPDGGPTGAGYEIVWLTTIEDAGKIVPAIERVGFRGKHFGAALDGVRFGPSVSRPR